MKENYHKTVNVLGIDVSVMRPEKAVNVSMRMMKERGLHKVFFLSAVGSLFCQNSGWAAELVRAQDMVFTGDSHTEMAASGQPSAETGNTGIGKFADEYLKRFFYRLNREYREIYAVMQQQEHLDDLQEYLQDAYPDIGFQGIVYTGETEDEPDKVVNEINAYIPDVVFLCLPIEQQLLFVRDYSSMMNSRLCVCIESLQPLVQKEIRPVPGWIRKLRLEGLYFKWIGDRKLQDIIVGSIFKKKVQNENILDVSNEENDETESFKDIPKDYPGE